MTNTTQHTPTPKTVNELIILGADGDSAAINVLDMIDANECGARTATPEQLGEWYEGGRQQ